MNVREMGQFSHNEVDMQFVEKPDIYPVPIYTVEFEFQGKDDAGDPVEPPLSWHLTPLEKRQLLDQWESKIVERNHF